MLIDDVRSVIASIELRITSYVESVVLADVSLLITASIREPVSLSASLITESPVPAIVDTIVSINVWFTCC